VNQRQQSSLNLSFSLKKGKAPSRPASSPGTEPSVLKDPEELEEHGKTMAAKGETMRAGGNKV